MANVDGRGLSSTAVLEEEAQVRSDGAQKRQQDAELKSHAGFIGPVRSTLVVPADDHLIGTTGCVLDQPAKATG
jgi:hypothetical protein